MLKEFDKIIFFHLYDLFINFFKKIESNLINLLKIEEKKVKKNSL